MPGVVLGGRNLFTDAESLSLCEVPPADSVLFPEVTAGSFCGSWGTTGRVPVSPPRLAAARGDTAAFRLASLRSALPRLPALLAPRPAAVPTLGSAAPPDPAACQPRRAPVSPQKLIHSCGCPQPPTWTMQGFKYERSSSSFLSA